MHFLKNKYANERVSQYRSATKIKSY